MELLSILVTLLVLFALARLGNRLFERFGMPGLIGEIIIGILIANIAINGTSLLDVLGLQMPSPGSELPYSEQYSVLYTLSELGVIFLLFSVGLETKVSNLLSVGKTALLVAILGVVIPMLLGCAYIMATDGNFHHAMFLGAAMVATSVGITARVIKDLHLIEKRESRIIIGAAVIDDVLGMIVLAIVKGVAGSDGGVSIGGIALIIIEACVFVLAIIAIAKWVVPRIYDWNQKRKAAYTERTGRIPQGFNDFILGIIVCLAFAALAEYIGLAAIIGSFLAGMLFADHAWESGMDKKVDSLTTFLISFFFLVVGLQVDLSQFSSVGVIVTTVIVIALALISKYVGCFAGARIGEHMDNKSCNIIGVGMIPRGEVGIIVATIGLNTVVDGSTALSPELYSIIVMMAVATTIIAPPILTRMYKAKYPGEFTVTSDDRI